MSLRLGYTKNKTSVSYRAIKAVVVNGKETTVIVKTFGTDKFICQTYGVSDAKQWAKEQVELMKQEEKEENFSYFPKMPRDKDIPLDEQRLFNGGYLFLQQIYYELGLDKICKAISLKHSFEYNLNSILSRLIYTRMLYPSSKRSSFFDSQRFIEQPGFELHDIYRALSVLAANADYIQSRVFKNSRKLAERKTGVIYYDCTNYYFETETAEDDKQYGRSKENRPLPIVEMGLFMDMEGIPLAFSIYPGNRNEQLSLIPMEKKLLENFGMSKFVVCTDAGLSSDANRKFNNHMDEDSVRGFITTQSVKKLKAHLKKWALEPGGWFLCGTKEKGKTYDLSELDPAKCLDRIFFKERWIKEDGLEQHLIVSFSFKYQRYMREIRSRQIERAMKKIKEGKSSVETHKQNDPKRFIKAKHATQDGEVACKVAYSLDQAAIHEEEKFDGFYALCTNLDDNVQEIIRINRRRWEIEECFRIMKTDFAARPVYVQRQERISAHFMTCFIALVIYRYLEKRLNNKYTCSEILKCLKEMNFLRTDTKEYVPVYTRTELTDALHAAFGFTTSKSSLSPKKIKNICAQTKRGLE